MLSLDDPRWSELRCRNGNASWVAQHLTNWLERPEESGDFVELWPDMCSEGTTWSAAYAAVPYVVELAKRLPREERFYPLCFIGLVAICSCPESGEPFSIQPYLAESYRQALTNALPLLADALVHWEDQCETRYLLAATAAVKGCPKLGQVLNQLECICGECPRCGESVYPVELQEAEGI